MRRRGRNEWRKKICHAKEQMRDCVVACLLFFFLFFDMLINSYVSSATSVRGSCTPIRNPATFFCSFLRGLEDVGESL